MNERKKYLREYTYIYILSINKYRYGTLSRFDNFLLTNNRNCEFGVGLILKYFKYFKYL